MGLSDMWVEQFEERSKIAGWNSAQQLHHFKLLLDKTALQVYQILTEEVMIRQLLLCVNGLNQWR